MLDIPGLLKISTADFIVRTAYQMGKTPLLPLFAASLGANVTILGLIVSVSTLTGILLKPIFGFFSDRWGRWIWLLTGTLLFAGIPFLYRWVTTPEELLILRLIHGLATAIYGPVTIAWVIEQGQQKGNPARNRAERLGWFGTARSGGYLLGPTIAAALLLVFEPSTVFTLIGLLSSTALLPVLLLKNSAPAKTPCFTLRQQTKSAFQAGIKTPELWLAGSLECVVYLGIYATKTFLPLYALESGISILWVGLFFSAQELFHLIGRPFGGRLSAISLGLLPLTNSPLSLLILAISFGLSQALIFPSTLALYAEKMDTRHTGTGVGMIGALKNSPKVAGPIFGGLLIHWQSYAWMFWSMSILLVLWSLVLLLNLLSEKTINPQRKYSRAFPVNT